MLKSSRAEVAGVRFSSRRCRPVGTDRRKRQRRRVRNWSGRM